MKAVQSEDALLTLVLVCVLNDFQKIRGRKLEVFPLVLVKAIVIQLAQHLLMPITILVAVLG